MTEAEWLACEDPDPMWRQLEDPTPAAPLLRKYRQLVCALARLAWHVHDEQGKRIVESMERYTDGIESLDEFSALVEDYWERVENESDQWRQAAGNCILGLSTAARHDNYPLRFAVTNGKLALAARHQSDDVWQSNHIPEICEAMRDIFGNPFRPVVMEPSRRTVTVVGLAQEMYAARDFTAMPILADALEDAGCTNRAILDHCRQPGEHARGCWVVDLVLGKE